MTTTARPTDQVYQVFIKATPGADLGGDHRSRVHDEVLPRRRGSTSRPSGARRPHPTARRPGATDAVFEWDPPRRLVHEWQSLYDPELAAEEPSRVTWEIEPQDGGSRS